MSEEVLKHTNPTFFSFMLRRKRLVLIPSIATIIFSIGVLSMLPNVYQSDALLVPNSNDMSLSGGIASQFGGLASLAGVDISGGKNDELNIALELMKSRSFINNFIDKYDLYEILFACNGWDSLSNKLTYNKNLFDENTKKRIHDDLWPSKLEMHKLFLEDNFKLSLDKETGVYRLAISHFSPYVAKTILENFINELNKVMRERAIKESRLQLEYLSKAILQEDRAEMLQVLYQLTSEHTKQKMLAEVRVDYIFKVLDPAYIPEEKIFPKRFLISVFILFSSFSLFTLIQFFVFTYRSENNAN